MESIVVNSTSHRYPVYLDMNSVHHNGRVYAEALKNLFTDKPIMLICKGTSGLAIATAVSAHLADCKVNYLRKPSEMDGASHSYSRSEISSSKLEDYYLVVVDDFVDTGATMSVIEEELRDEYEESYTGIDCLCSRNTERELVRCLDEKYGGVFKERRYQLICQK